jgi:hypothetical protein
LSSEQKCVNLSKTLSLTKTTSGILCLTNKEQHLSGKPLNSCIERFWRSAKCERIYLNEYQSISELITDVMDVYQESIKLNQEKAKAS